MADEIRNVEARLKITKEGDQDAFKEATEDVKGLGQAAEEASAPIESAGDQVAGMATKVAKAMVALQAVGAILQTAARSAEVLGEAFGGLDEETADTVGSIGELGRALSSLDVMGAAAAAGRTLGNVYNDLTDATKGTASANTDLLNTMAGQRERLQSIIAIQQQLVNSEKARRQELDLTAEALTRQAAVEQKAGDLSKGTADKIRQTVEAYKAMGVAVPEALDQVAQSLSSTAEAQEAFAASLGVSKKGLDEQAKAFSAFAAQFAATNAQLSGGDFAEIFGGKIQSLLDSYAALKQAPPAALQTLAQSWGVATTAATQAAEVHKSAVQSIVSQITGISEKVGPSLAELSQQLSEALEGIDFNGLDASALERAKNLLERFVDQSRAAGKQIPQDIADQAASLGVLVNAMEVASGGANELGAAQGELAQQAGATKVVFDQATGTLRQVATAAAGAGAAAKTAGGQIAEGAAAAGAGAEPLLSLKGEFTALQVAQIAAGMAGKSAGEAIKDGADKVGEAAAGLKDTGQAAGEAGTGMQGAATAAAGLGPASDTGKAGLDKLTEALAAAPAAAAPIVAALGQVQSTLAALDLSKIDQLATKLNTAATAAQNLNTALQSGQAATGAAGPI